MKKQLLFTIRLCAFLFIVQYGYAQQINFIRKGTGELRTYQLPKRAEITLMDGSIYMQAPFARSVIMDSIRDGTLFVHRRNRLGEILLSDVRVILLPRDFFTTVITMWGAYVGGLFGGTGLLFLGMYISGTHLDAGPSPALAAGMVLAGGTLAFLCIKYNMRRFPTRKWQVQ
jgi:hypothetical protein